MRHRFLPFHDAGVSAEAPHPFREDAQCAGAPGDWQRRLLRWS